MADNVAYAGRDSVSGKYIYINVLANERYLSDRPPTQDDLSRLSVFMGPDPVSGLFIYIYTDPITGTETTFPAQRIGLPSGADAPPIRPTPPLSNVVEDSSVEQDDVVEESSSQVEVDDDVDDDVGNNQLLENNSNSPNSENEIIGRRQKNPLGFFSSYTYQISLYMVTPDAYDAFIQSGRTNLNVINTAQGNQGGGALLIAQSGGINNQTDTRAPGFELDYYIENLSIKTFANPKATMSESNTTTVTFQIIEPYGFSFITKLKNASEKIREYSSNLGNGEYLIQNPSKQFFILGLKFLGYDANGNVITGNGQTDNGINDPNTTNGIPDRYYDIFFTGIKFKIDGNATTYNVSAVSVAPKVAFGVRRGMITTNVSIDKETVGEAIDYMLDSLNKTEENLLNNGSIEHANEYLVEFRGEGAEKIEKADIVTPEDFTTLKWQAHQARNTTEVNVASENDATASNSSRIIQFKNDTPIIHAISQVITQSAYLRDALLVVFKNVPEPGENGYESDQPNEDQTIAWYNLSAEISDAKWDDIRKDFAYKITYVIQRYETPVLQSEYVTKGIPYYGPHKRYEYWYTGQNSEILSYEQQLDNTYYNVALSDLPINREPSSTNSNPPTEPNRPTGASREGTQNTGKEAQNNYVTSLFDPGAFATAKITILGDPDFLAQDSPGSLEEVYTRFYGDDGFTINPAGGQVFIEIDFKEAIDYDISKGVMDINESILFWKYPDEIAQKIQGVSYQVIDVTSTFQRGIFRQVLNCVINTFGLYENIRPINQREEPSNLPRVLNTGFIQDPDPNENLPLTATINVERRQPFSVVPEVPEIDT